MTIIFLVIRGTRKCHCQNVANVTIVTVFSKEMRNVGFLSHSSSLVASSHSAGWFYVTIRGVRRHRNSEGTNNRTVTWHVRLLQKWAFRVFSPNTMSAYIFFFLHPAEISTLVRFEVFTAVSMKNAVFWDVHLVWTDVSEERIASIFRVEKTSMNRWLQTAIHSSETLVHTRCTRHPIPEDGIPQIFSCLRSELFTAVKFSVFCFEICRFVYGYRGVGANIISAHSDFKFGGSKFSARGS
jgi:hypothetical protein